ncbi:MAG: hypothetical protein DRQ78_07885 [Epsilonproteobacteria bacterium]|nr:MAG: hypothetical protein DRQ78_07885 [Campylobacterota bacterium]
MSRTLSMKTIVRIAIPVIIMLGILVTAPMTIGINDAGQRTVIQYPSGELLVKFSPGWYPKYFGKTTEYNDMITFDFDRSESEGGVSTLDQAGISVRYQDGGMGTIYGKSRYFLPTDEKTMIELHKAFRSNAGVANKVIKPVTEEAMNLTAGLMRSEEGYATKRAIFTELAKDQVSKGPYVTRLDTITVKDEATGKSVYKQIPVIKVGEDGIQMHRSSDLAVYGISLKGFQLNDPGFEPSTMKQISDKREATMAIITAKANAEKAKQMAITAEEDGKAAVMTAQYEMKVIKERAVVDAERVKEVAEIKAKQKVEVAKQATLEATQFKNRAKEIKQANILEGEGLAEKKRLLMEADGALEQKISAYKHVMTVAFTEFGKQKWVPEVQMGASGSGSGSEAANLINILTAKTLTDLGLDMKINPQAVR